MMLRRGMLYPAQPEEPSMPTSSAADFHSRVRQAGLPLNEAEATAVLPAWQKLEAWLELLRRPPLPAEAEPVTTFKASAAATLPTDSAQ
jgi:hypothetical protein